MPDYSRWVQVNVIDSNSSETTEQRQARLRQMSSRQRDRLASESMEERDERLDEQRLHQEERESSSQLVSNSSVQMKMRTFHSRFATLTSPKCSESFPHVQIYLSVTMYWLFMQFSIFSQPKFILREYLDYQLFLWLDWCIRMQFLPRRELVVLFSALNPRVGKGLVTLERFLGCTGAWLNCNVMQLITCQLPIAMRWNAKSKSCILIGYR